MAKAQGQNSASAPTSKVGNRKTKQKAGKNVKGTEDEAADVHEWHPARRDRQSTVKEKKWGNKGRVFATSAETPTVRGLAP